MFFIKLLFLFCIPLSSQASPLLKSQSFLLAENQSGLFDPFIDYGEFQDNVTEQESINFFQNGRSLNIHFLIGYEAITFNLRQIYGDSPGAIGASVGFFFDLNFALHVSGLFPHPHYNTLLSTTPNFSSINLDFKYYFNKQKLTKGVAEIFNPYLIFGPFWLTVGGYDVQNAQPTPTAVSTNVNGPTPTSSIGSSPPVAPPSAEEVATLSASKSFGFKLGVGAEVPFVKQTYLGVEVAYLYANLDFENEDLSNLDIKTVNAPNKTFFDRLIFPDTPEVKGYRFYGDMLTTVFIFGVNF